MNRTVKFLGGCLLILSLANAGFSQSKLLTRDTFFEMESVGSPQISPDGTSVLFTRTGIDKVKDSSASNLWITDAKGERTRQLTEGGWRDSGPVWSPDGKRIAFLSDRDGTTQLYVMWLDTREIAKLTNSERTPGGVVWSPDGRQLAYTQFEPDRDPILAIKLPERPAGATWAKPPTLVNRLSWGQDGVGPTQPGTSQIYVLDAILGGTPRKVTSGAFSFGSPSWSKDGKTLFASATKVPDDDWTKGAGEIYAIEAQTGAMSALTDRKGPDSGPTVSRDGKWIAYTGFDHKDFTSHLSSLYLMDTKGAGKKVLATGLPNSPSGATWAPDSSGVYFLMGKEGSTNLWFVSLEGKISEITKGVQQLGGFSLSDNGTVATVRSTFTNPGVLSVFSLRRASDMLELVDVNKDVLSGVSLSTAEELWATSKDGLKVQGWLVKPANYQEGKKFPLVLWIHGGPWSMYGIGWSWPFQNWAAEGYGVLFTNPRGSTGYGQDFVNGIQYSYPGKDYDDLMACVDAAVAKGWVDPKNLFVCGGSGGGCLTAWIVGHTDRFAGACAMRPVIDWISFNGTTDGGRFWYDQFEKLPWEDPTDHLKRSPLTYVSNVVTPTMVMTGEADLRTPISQSEEFYRAMKLLKKDTLLVRMPDEFHGWRRPSHQLMQQLYLMAWFEKHKR
ncbi:MAG: S9 family peptidase [Armatimonadetes bacterium]|nr:S9 family peptidase [Armatimonadota bacterium]